MLNQHMVQTGWDKEKVFKADLGKEKKQTNKYINIL